ncbi:MAG: TraB/GumN family protein [Methanomassiliicoccales archaeon]|nr:TraB/GumN family protein [Methanomassiliicoccales archaeon]
MITIVGVGHVFDIREQVRDIILSEMPGAVCVELDPSRYHALRNPQSRGGMPPTYRLLSHFQKRMAKDFGGELGSEMLAAIDAAREAGIAALLIDADASQLFTKLWQEMPFKERVMLSLSALAGIFTSKKKVERELQRFTEQENAYLEEFGKEYPTMKRVLIDERNQLMAGRIAEAEARYINVVAVVGDGHVEGLRALLAPREVLAIRLKQLLAKDYPRGSLKVGEGNKEISFQYNYG